MLGGKTSRSFQMLISRSMHRCSSGPGIREACLRKIKIRKMIFLESSSIFKTR